jgi:hypothetical protein
MRTIAFVPQHPIPLAPLGRGNQNPAHSPPSQGGFRGIALPLATPIAFTVLLERLFAAER